MSKLNATGQNRAAGRLLLANACLTTLLIAPLISTMAYDGDITRALTLGLMLGFNLLMLPDAIQSILLARHDRLLRIGAIIAVFSMFAWHYFQGPILGNQRFWFYIGLAVFFYAACAWFRALGEHGMKRVFVAKFSLMLVSLVAIGGAMILTPLDTSALMHALPLYWNIRHFNYDLTAVIGLGVYFCAVSSSRIGLTLLVAAFSVMGYFSAWSGGRGEMLALALFFSLLLWRTSSWRDRRIWTPIAALLLGALFVPILGEGQLLFNQLSKLGSSSMDHVSSGRLDLWLSSLQRWVETPASLLFGYAPDAYLRMGVRSSDSVHQFAQPHNVIIQWLLEFGLLGTGVLVVLYGRVVWNAWSTLRSSKGLNLRMVVAALLLSLFVYALMDGLLYHVIPLTFIVLLCAYLSVSIPEQVEGGLAPARHS